MYKIRWMILCLFCSHNMIAQNREKDFSGQIIISDFYGRPFDKYSPDIEGSPFLEDRFYKATLLLHNGRVIDSLGVRIDLYKQEIDIKMPNDIEAVAGPGMIKEILLQDSAQPQKLLYKFRSGFPAVDNQNENNYYQVLADGKITLVKSIRKKIAEQKNDISGEIVKVFETYEDYYLVVNKVMIKAKRNTSFFEAQMTDKKEPVKKYIKDHNINCRYMDKAAELVAFYNSL